jgi:hypothetical protein
MGLFDFIMNKNNKDDDDKNDEIIILPNHMEIFDFDIDNILYSERDINDKLNEEFEDYIECEMVFSRN